MAEAHCGENFTLSTDNLRHQFNTCLYRTFDQPACDLTSLHSFKYKLLTALMSEWEITREDLNNLYESHTPVHPKVSEDILKRVRHKEDWLYIFAQDFVKNDKLVKVLQSLYKDNYVNYVYGLLAVDGYGMHKVSSKSKPVFDIKKYLYNLKYSLCGKEGWYDNEPDDYLKRTHAQSIRKVCEYISKRMKNSTECICKYTHQVMYKVIKDTTDADIPDNRVEPQLPTKTLNACVRLYKKSMSAEYIEEYLKRYLKISISDSMKKDANEENENEENEKEESDDDEEENNEVVQPMES